MKPLCTMRAAGSEVSRLTRRRLAVRLVCGMALGKSCLSAAGPSVAVVTNSTVPAYREAVSGILEVMPGLPVFDLAHPDQARGVGAALAELRPRLVVAVGSHAAEAASASGLPVISTMVLDGRARGGNHAGAVTLEVPFGAVLAQARRLWPGVTRAGILYDPAHNPARTLDCLAEAKRQGFSLELAAASGPHDLLDAFLSLKRRVGFVWCPPDNALFNSTTVQPLLMSSLRNGLPIVGFSESFVRAGAAMGIYPDYHDIGTQAADMARRYLAGGVGAPQRETPRSLRVGINHRVLRLLGKEFAPLWEGEARVEVFR